MAGGTCDDGRVDHAGYPVAALREALASMGREDHPATPGCKR